MYAFLEFAIYHDGGNGETDTASHGDKENIVTNAREAAPLEKLLKGKLHHCIRLSQCVSAPLNLSLFKENFVTLSMES